MTRLTFHKLASTNPLFFEKLKTCGSLLANPHLLILLDLVEI